MPGTAKELVETVNNDKHLFVTLLAALIRADLRKVPVDDKKGTVDSGRLLAALIRTDLWKVPVHNKKRTLGSGMAAS